MMRFADYLEATTAPSAHKVLETLMNALLVKRESAGTAQEEEANSGKTTLAAAVGINTATEEKRGAIQTEAEVTEEELAGLSLSL